MLMDDSLLFMQWDVSTLQHQDPGASSGGGEENVFPSLQAFRDADVLVQELTEAQNSLSSGVVNGGGGGIISPARSWSTSSPSSGGPFAPRSISSTGTSNPLSMIWNFSTVLAEQSTSGRSGWLAAAGPSQTLSTGSPLGSGVSQPTRRASVTPRSAGSTPYAQDHTMAERKRREKINQRFIELSAVIPGIKKMDKGTILTDATRYVKELQERIRSLEAAGSNHRSIETVVLVRKPCRPVLPDDDEGSRRFYSVTGFMPAIRSQLPEIEVKLSENKVMVRIHCEINGKGLVARVLAEIEELHLRIVHNVVMPFTGSTVIITTMAKVEEGFTVNVKEIGGRVNSVLYQDSSSSSGNNSR